VLEYPTQTAALLTPYNDAKGKPGKSSGQIFIPRADMDAFIAEAGKRGFNIHVHAIGDGAVRETLDAFAAARAAGSKQLFSIAHLQLIEPSDIPRFAKLNVFLPCSCSGPSLTTTASTRSRRGSGTSAWAASIRRVPWSTLAPMVAGGSDWDVSSYNPFEAMATAMSRKNPEQPERAPAGSPGGDDPGRDARGLHHQRARN
jgi:predicted amidohydrolase YtcJ